jgi:chromosome segregation ATPase
MRNLWKHIDGDVT